MPSGIAAMGAGFTAADRADEEQLRAAPGTGADLLVDCLCYTAADARLLLPLAADATSTVLISSRAVYADADGNHANSDVPPRFDGPVRETRPTVAPGDMDHRSREGYGPNKVAAEQVALDSGLPVTVVRPSRVHGVGAARPREWVFVKRALDRRAAVLLARRGTGVVHPTAAANIAALVETVDRAAGRARPQPRRPRRAERPRHLPRHRPTPRARLGRSPPRRERPGPAGTHPWDSPHPAVLDTSAAEALGHRPAGDYATTAAAEIDWLAAARTGDAAGILPRPDDPYFRPFFDYAAEDAFLTAHTRRA